MKLSNDLREFVQLLNSTNVKYVLVGGHAVAWHGYPRYTGDIDFFVERSSDNAARLEDVLRSFGFAALGLTAKDFLEPDVVVQLGRPPNRIDLLTSIDGVKFDEAWAARTTADVGGIRVPIISKEHLIQNKRATGRAQDRADLERLEV